jgi:hypothetical protein
MLEAALRAQADAPAAKAVLEGLTQLDDSEIAELLDRYRLRTDLLMELEGGE